MKVITIAIGQPYLNMAYNLAASCYGKHDVVLITDQVVGNEYDHLFDTVVEPMYVGETDMETALINKLHLDEYADGEMLFLDADTILFKKFHNDNGNLFTPIVLHKSIKYPEWMSADVARKHYGVDKLIRCNTSWIYFDGTKKFDVVFKQARKVYEDAVAEKYEYRKFRNHIADEMCFDVAMSLHGDICTTYPNMPLQLPFVRYEGMIHTFDGYYGISMAGINGDNKELQHLYDQLAQHYALKCGLPQSFAYERKTMPVKPRKSGSRDIGIFYHVAMMGNWERVVDEQLGMMLLSGLYDRAASISIGCVGSAEDKATLKKIIKPYHKINIAAHSTNFERYEFITLELLQNYCKHRRGYYVLYLHTKGVFLSQAGHWRAYMNHYNITLWSKCVDALNEGYDTVGVKYIDDNSGFPRHYSGNF